MKVILKVYIQFSNSKIKHPSYLKKFQENKNAFTGKKCVFFNSTIRESYFRVNFPALQIENSITSGILLENNHLKSPG